MKGIHIRLLKLTKPEFSTLVFVIPLIGFLIGVPITYDVFKDYYNGSFPSKSASEVSDMLNLIVGLPLIIVTSFLALFLAAIAFKLAATQDKRDSAAQAQEAVKLYTSLSLGIKILDIESKSMIKQYQNYLHEQDALITDLSSGYSVTPDGDIWDNQMQEFIEKDSDNPEEQLKYKNALDDLNESIEADDAISRNKNFYFKNIFYKKLEEIKATISSTLNTYEQILTNIDCIHLMSDEVKIDETIELRNNLTKSIKYCSYLQESNTFYKEMSLLMAYERISQDSFEEQFVEDKSAHNLISCLISHEITSNENGMYIESNGFEIIRKLLKLIPKNEEFDKHFFTYGDSPFPNAQNLNELYKINNDNLVSSTTLKIKFSSGKIKAIGEIQEDEYDFLYAEQLKREIAKRTEYYS